MSWNPQFDQTRTLLIAAGIAILFLLISGCVVWVFREEEEGTTRMKLSYRYFGDKAGKRLPSLDGFKVARHTKGNADGENLERKAIRVVPKREFKPVEDIRALVKILFGLKG